MEVVKVDLEVEVLVDEMVESEGGEGDEKEAQRSFSGWLLLCV